MKKSLLLLPAIGFFSFTLFTNGVVVEDVAAFSTGAPAAKTGDQVREIVRIVTMETLCLEPG